MPTDPPTLRVATWNLERPPRGGGRRVAAQKRAMADVAADLWILTETRASLAPGGGYHALHVPPHPTRRPDLDERWVSLWSRWPLEPVGPPPSPRGSIAARCATPLGELIVYGCVIPWMRDPGSGPERARSWQVHYEEIERMGEEWRQLRAAYPAAGLLVGGDFNQTRDGSSSYGTREGRERLTRRLEAAGLVCLTEDDAVATRRLARNHLVDHLCLSSPWLPAERPRYFCWEPVNEEGVRMSDHPGVAIDLKIVESPFATDRT